MGAGARARSEAEGRAARRVPACACHAARPRSTRRGRRARSKRPARRGPTRVKGGGGGRLHERFGRTARPTRTRCRREEAKVASSPEAPVPARAATPGDGGGRKRERRRPRTHLTARLCTHVEATRARRGGLRGAAEEEGEDAPHTNAPYATAPPFSAAPASRLGPSARRRTNAPRELPGGDDPRSEPILRTAGRGPSSAVSGLSRAPEGRPRMPERRPDPVLGHSLIEALRGLPEAPPGSSQAARTPV